jgi:hypothetical protein
MENKTPICKRNNAIMTQNGIYVVFQRMKELSTSATMGSEVNTFSSAAIVKKHKLGHQLKIWAPARGILSAVRGCCPHHQIDLR